MDHLVQSDLELLNQQVIKESAKIKQFLALGVLSASAVIIAQSMFFAALVYYYMSKNDYASPLLWSSLAAVGTILFFVAYTLRPLFLDSQAPKGIQVKPDSPLSKIVEDLSEQLDTPAIESIFLTDEMNASVCSTRSWKSPAKRHYLSMGVQLLSSVSKAEAVSIIAHELGHVSRSHTSFSGFVYQAYLAMFRLYDLLNSSEGIGDQWLAKALGKYIKKFDALSYATKRNHEFQADMIAAQVNGAELMASALCRIEMVAYWLDDHYWTSVWRNCWKHPVPPPGVVVNACKSAMNCSVENMTGYFESIRIQKTHKGDTHPSLSDRVGNLGVKAKVPAQLDRRKSALLLLGGDPKQALFDCDNYWQDSALQQWQYRHECMSEHVMRRDFLIKSKHERSLIHGELCELARLEDMTRGSHAAAKAYLDAYKDNRQDLNVLLEVGRSLLKLKDARAVPALIKAMKASPRNEFRGSSWLASHFEVLGDEVKATLFKTRIAQAKQRIDLEECLTNRTLGAHGLTAAQLNEIKLWLKYIGDIRWACLYLVETNPRSAELIFELVIDTESCLHDDYADHVLGGIVLPGSIRVLDAEEYDGLEDLVKSHKNFVIFGESL